MEKLMYETRPYAFFLLALAALSAQSAYPVISMFFSGILLVCSGLILYWRHTERQLVRSRRPRRW
jgi:hypothetical protein